MRKLALIGSSIVVAAAIIACRGSVDRVFDPDPSLTSAEAGHLDAGLDGQTNSADGGDGGTIKDRDAEVDSGPPPKTAAAVITVTVNNGLFGSGLALQNNGADDLPAPSPGSYSFPIQIPPGQPYNVTVSNQPVGPSQTCTVLNGSGTAVGEDVKNIQVNCTTATYAIGGSVVGLTAGQSVTLVNNGASDIVVNADGTFTFPALASGAPFEVTIKATTPATTCAVSGGKGAIAGAAIDSVVVNCGTNTYTVGGTVSGLVGTLVVQNNGGNDRSITTNGGFAFSTPIQSGKPYAVTVKTNPTYLPPQQPQAQTCTVTQGTGSGNVGAGNVTTVDIKCTTNKYTVGGTVKGLTGAGLKLQNKGTDDKIITAGAGSVAFTFATSIASASQYSVTVAAQPAGQTCNVQNPSGTIGSANYTGIIVNCAASNPLQQDFQSITPPALPDGWTTVALFSTASLNKNKWTTVLDSDGTDKYASFPDPDIERDVALVSPVFSVSSTTAKLSFTHYMDAEPGWDGGVLEIKIGAADWTDILVAGGSFVTDGYNVQKLENDGSNEIGGRAAWSGYDMDMDTLVTLPASAAGQSIQLRWRFGSDDGSSADGSIVDDVLVKN